MKINQISTQALNNMLRSSTLEKQNALADAQKELSTGKHADLGRELSSFTSSYVSLEAQLNAIDQQKVTNSFLTGRLETMQNGISGIIDGANGFVGQLALSISDNLNAELNQRLGAGFLDDLNSIINVTFKGEFVFSGINSDAPSLVSYGDGDGMPARTAVQNAFVAEFGFSADNPAAASISPAAFEAFVDGAFSDLFDDANWETLWSGSSERGIKSKLSTRDLAEVPTTAHREAFRGMVASAVLVAEFANSSLNDATSSKLAELSVIKARESIAGFSGEQSKVGLLQERVAQANDRMDFQSTILASQAGAISDVDPYETALRLQQIFTNLEASYSATARIQNLSLLNFI